MFSRIQLTLTFGVSLVAATSATAQDASAVQQEIRANDAASKKAYAGYQDQKAQLDSKYPGWNANYSYRIHALKAAIEEGSKSVLPIDPRGVGFTEASTLQRNYEVNKRLDKLRAQLAELERLNGEKAKLEENAQFKADLDELNARWDKYARLQENGLDLAEKLDNAVEAQGRAEQIREGLQALLVFGLEKAPFLDLYYLAKELEQASKEDGAAPVISPESDELLADLIIEELKRRSPEKLAAMALMEYYSDIVYGGRSNDSQSARSEDRTYEQLVGEVAQTTELTSSGSASSEQEQDYLDRWQDTGGRRLTPEEMAEMDAEFADIEGAPINPDFMPGANPFSQVDSDELQDIIDRSNQALAEFDRLFGLDGSDGSSDITPADDIPVQPGAAGLDNPFGFGIQAGSPDAEGAPIDPDFTPGADPFERVDSSELDDIIDRSNQALAEFDRLFGLDGSDGSSDTTPADDIPVQPGEDGLDNPFGFGIQAGSTDAEGAPIDPDFVPGANPFEQVDGSDLDDIIDRSNQALAEFDRQFGLDDPVGVDVPDSFSDDINNAGNTSMMMTGVGNPNPFPVNQNFGATNVFVTQNAVDPSVFNFNGSDPFSVPGFNVDNFSGFVTCPTFNNLPGPDFLNVTGYFNPSGTFMSGGHNNVGGSLRNVTITDGTTQFCTGGTGGANAMIVP